MPVQNNLNFSTKFVDLAIVYEDVLLNTSKKKYPLHSRLRIENDEKALYSKIRVMVAIFKC
jgi:hypothetical protein